MSNAVQVAKLVEGALSGDLEKVRAYATLIADHFEQDEEARSARIVRRSLGLEPAGAPVALDALKCPVCGKLESVGCMCNYVRAADGSVKIW